MVAVSGAGWRLAPCLVRCVDELDEAFPLRDHWSDGSIGDLSHQARSSDHNPDDGWVCAVDLDEDLSGTVHSLMPVAEQWRKAKDPRIKYVIYEGRIYKGYVDSAGHPAWTWQPYTGTNAHTHHLHLSVWNTAAARNDLDPWGFAAAYAPPKPAPTAPIPATPTEDDDLMLILIADGRPTRLLTPVSLTGLDAASHWNLAASGVKQSKLTVADYDEIIVQAKKRFGLP